MNVTFYIGGGEANFKALLLTLKMGIFAAKFPPLKKKFKISQRKKERRENESLRRVFFLLSSFFFPLSLSYRRLFPPKKEGEGTLTNFSSWFKSEARNEICSCFKS